MNFPSNPADRKAIFDCIKLVSESMTKIDSEREFIKEAIKDICDSKNISKKTFRRMAKVYYKQNFDKEVEEHEEFETLYENVTNFTKMAAKNEQ